MALPLRGESPSAPERDAMRWVCLLFPRLALEGALRRRPDPEAPFALIDGPVQRQCIRAANRAAREQGVKPGQALGFAEALFNAPEHVQVNAPLSKAPGHAHFNAPDASPDRGSRSGSSQRLETALFDVDSVERWRRRLATWAYGFSAQVSLHYPHALVFEVASSLDLLGPWPRLEARLRAELTALGFSHRLVIAPNPAAARVLVNVHDGLAVDDTGLESALATLRLDRAGLASIDADRDILQTLNRSGFQRLGELFALPRNALARRFGGGLMRHLAELRGEWPLALDYHRPTPRFSRTFEFDQPVHAIAGLAFPLKRLLQELGVFLMGQDAGVERFRLTFELEDGPPQTVEIGLLAVQRDPDTLLELTRAHLERVRLAGPVTTLTLFAPQLAAYAPIRRELLEGPARQAQAWAALHQRLVARLGAPVLKTLVEHREHRPEKAVLNGAGPRARDASAGPPRPGWLASVPQRCDGDVVQLLAGPERIESGWWDGDDIRRDYYLAQWADGRQAWVWCEPERQGWYLHGWFG
ncbi:DNA polymerase Y family protein [Salinicola sp. MH3R3-1]|uniref:Y-family DNA polymerase n=1 Tax=Salinicola sp. MH3R3-1 TaxID=1928762 RepID=UPI0011151178|nr:DNA polymerase Y family protein [Salinicola sp. MH3R3-1]